MTMWCIWKWMVLKPLSCMQYDGVSVNIVSFQVNGILSIFSLYYMCYRITYSSNFSLPETSIGLIILIKRHLHDFAHPTFIQWKVTAHNIYKNEMPLAPYKLPVEQNKSAGYVLWWSFLKSPYILGPDSWSYNYQMALQSPLPNISVTNNKKNSFWLTNASDTQSTRLTSSHTMLK